MENHARQIEPPAAVDSKTLSSTVDFHSVINLKDYAGGAAKVDIDSSVTERPSSVKGGIETVASNEKVRLTENGHSVPEHVLNNLTLTDHGHEMNVKDNTVVMAGRSGQHKDSHEGMHRVTGLGHEHATKHLPHLKLEEKHASKESNESLHEKTTGEKPMRKEADEKSPEKATAEKSPEKATAEKSPEK